MLFLISKARLASNQDLLEAGSVLEQTTLAVWLEALEDVPLNKLNECYLAAIKKHSNSFPLGVSEIAAVWHEEITALAERPKVSEIQRKAVEEYCAPCSGTGFEVVPGKGARPCAHCNAARAVDW